jgi:opacity protein-like surface antigen
MNYRQMGAIVVLTVCTGIAALPPNVAGADGKGPYLNFEAGVNLMDQGEGAAIDADTGLRLGAAWGYCFNSWFGMELEAAWLLNPGKPADGGSTDWLGQTPVLINLLFRYETESGWTPYAGAGLGPIIFHDDEEPGGDAAFQWTFGLRRAINNSTSIGVSYKIIALFATSLFADEWLGNDSINACLNWKY